MQKTQKIDNTPLEDRIKHHVSRGMGRHFLKPWFVKMEQQGQGLQGGPTPAMLQSMVNHTR
jgi:hypothetical protein